MHKLYSKKPQQAIKVQKGVMIRPCRMHMIKSGFAFCVFVDDTARKHRTRPLLAAVMKVEVRALEIGSTHQNF